MSKKRIQVYADPEMKRRIEVAATKHNVAVTEYCLDAIEQQLADDDVLEEEHITIPLKEKNDDTLIADLRALQKKILARRGGKPIEVDRIMDEMRAERDEELIGVR